MQIPFFKSYFVVSSCNWCMQYAERIVNCLVSDNLCSVDSGHVCQSTSTYILVQDEIFDDKTIVVSKCISPCMPWVCLIYRICKCRRSAFIFSHHRLGYVSSVDAPVIFLSSQWKYDITSVLVGAVWTFSYFILFASWNNCHASTVHMFKNYFECALQRVSWFVTYFLFYI